MTGQSTRNVRVTFLRLVTITGAARINFPFSSLARAESQDLGSPERREMGTGRQPRARLRWESMAKAGESGENPGGQSNPLESDRGPASSLPQTLLVKSLVFPTSAPLVFPLMSASPFYAENSIKRSHQNLRSRAFTALVFDI